MRALNDYQQFDYELYFWRDANQQEVDLVLYGPRGIKAFEIKRSNRIHHDDLSALQSFLPERPLEASRS